METRLDEYFTTNVGSVGKADYTGLIGAYAHGNEPAHHVAFWYNLIGQNEKTDKSILKRFCMKCMGINPIVLLAMTMLDKLAPSAWFVLATLGIYPVDPTKDIMYRHTPYVNEATLITHDGPRIPITSADSSLPLLA